MNLKSNRNIQILEEVILPSKYGSFKMLAYEKKNEVNMPHLALVSTKIDVTKPVHVRIHSECLTGDLFGSMRCECGEQLNQAMKLIDEKNGILIYLRQEGRGIGLINKMKAYRHQDTGLNTVEANEILGLKIDSREYNIAINILKSLDVESIYLITNNPKKVNAIKESDLELKGRVPLEIEANEVNIKYLETKKSQLGHHLNNI